MNCNSSLSRFILESSLSYVRFFHYLVLVGKYLCGVEKFNFLDIVFYCICMLSFGCFTVVFTASFMHVRHICTFVFNWKTKLSFDSCALSG